MDGNIVKTLRKDLGLESTINNIKMEILIQNSLRWNSSANYAAVFGLCSAYEVLSDPKITEWAERMHCTLRLEAAKNHLLCECALSKQEEAVEASIEELLNRSTKAEVRKGAQILSLVADRITTFSDKTLEMFKKTHDIDLDNALSFNPNLPKDYKDYLLGEAQPVQFCGLLNSDCEPEIAQRMFGIMTQSFDNQGISEIIPTLYQYCYTKESEILESDNCKEFYMQLDKFCKDVEANFELDSYAKLQFDFFLKDFAADHIQERDEIGRF